MSKETILKKHVINYYLTTQNFFVLFRWSLQPALMKSMWKGYKFVLDFDVLKAFLKFVFRSLHSLSTYLWQKSVPLLSCLSYGFIGMIRSQVSEHCVIESHPDNLLEDLHLDKPFPGLIEFMENIKLTDMDHKQFSHTPYLVLLYKALEIWRTSHESKLPSTYKEKESLRKIIKNCKS